MYFSGLISERNFSFQKNFDRTRFIVNENGNSNFRGVLVQNSFGLCDKTEMH